jgi:hypothetical protein
MSAWTNAELDKIDAAYASKYRRYASIIPSINSPTARSATIKLVPRNE